jgi:protein-disulfide isomerase
MKKLSRFVQTTEGKFITGVIAVVVILFAYYFYAMKTKPTTQEAEITISDTDHVRGAMDGKVTLVEFGDFQCPACGAYEPLLRKVTEDNAKTLKVVFRHFPLTQIHPNALIAAKASEAAGLQGKFWEMHDILYEKQEEWSTGLTAHDFIFLNYATAIGLNMKKFQVDLNSKEVEDKILTEYKEGVKLGVQGTPTFFLNGKKINNPQSPEEFNKLIAESSK